MILSLTCLTRSSLWKSIDLFPPYSVCQGLTLVLPGVALGDVGCLLYYL